jgi:hypothetical protein
VENDHGSNSMVVRISRTLDVLPYPSGPARHARDGFVSTSSPKRDAQPPASEVPNSQAANWPGYALKRHNDAKHPIYKLTLAYFDLRVDDPGIPAGIEMVMEHQSSEGAFQIPVNIPKAFGGTGKDAWTWMSCSTTPCTSSKCLVAFLSFTMTSVSGA